MKRIYLPLVFSLLAMSGCSDKNNAEVKPSSVSDKEAVSTSEVESDKKEEKCVIPDVEGYDQVGCLRDGLAGVIKQSNDEHDKTDRVGYIDKDGQLIIPFEFDAIVAGESGESLEFNDFSEGLAAVNKNDKYGFIGTKGKVVIEPQYEWASSFSDGLAIVSAEGLYGAIDKQGKTVIPFEYQALADFQEGFATAARSPKDPEDYESKYGLINKQNEVVIPFMYESMGNLSESLIAVKKDGKWGYVDTTNKSIISINLAYEIVSDFSDGLAAVFNYEENSDNLKYGYIDKTGKLVIPMQFTKAYWDDTEGLIDFSNGIAVVNDKEGRTFCIDKKGKETQCPDGIGDADNQLADESEALEEEALEAKSNGTPQFIAITDYIALKPNENWTWDKLVAIPYAEKWFNKTPVKNGYRPEDPNYYISASLNETSSMAAYGTKSQPNIITLSSGQGITEDESLGGIYELNDFFSQNDLTRISSNCDVDSRFVQKFYKWEKKGFQPLYLYDVTMPSNSGSNTEFGIAKSLEEFFKPEYESLGLQSIDNNYDEVICTFK
ncbi:WG repeat-containing protein [Psychrobacter sp. DAB_AL62B]|uniref:WG repeat-containing protein n=1 Tax=Psychrobacter sp. DAB_AL62B TaxID=1028420 RepID=UPI0023811D97|nr:WG repeat-containing protein [Psychrobacter sp. DAB_AL62B]MDE4456079.1 WG repeat-containing protein [Psychrobacter sp. DAB_AL62B]